MSTILITGSNRGIGLELVRQLSQLSPDKIQKIFAVTRRAGEESDQLTQLIRKSEGRVEEIVIEDITNEESTRKGVEKVSASLSLLDDGGSGKQRGLDILINNAGVCTFNPEGIQTLSSKELLEVFDVNVVSAQVVSAGFLALLKAGRGRKILNMSTTLGSISRVKSYSWATTYAYNISKAAMNMLTAQWALGLEKEGFTVFAMSPGWLKTDLGSQNADLDVGTGVTAVLKKLFSADRSDNGKFWNIRVPGWENTGKPSRYEGEEVEW